jgi:hypothetical protein
MAQPQDTQTGQPFTFSAWHFAAVLGLLLFAAFPKVMLGQHSFFFRDYGVLGYPFVAYAHESFWRGELPLWNPLSNCGTPFLAQWGTMALYPFSLIYLLFPLPWSLGYFCLGHLFLAGLGMYWLAREWTRNDFAAAFAGMVYVFNGVMFSSLIWPNYIVALAWMPLVVLWTHRAWRHGGRSIALAAIVGAMQMLSGVPELVLLTWFLVGAICLAEWISAPRALRPCSRLAVVILLVAGLSAVQLLPFFDLLAHSQRSSDFATSKWAMPGWGWANLLIPLFHTYKSAQGPCFQHDQAFMTSYYPGVAVLLLAAWAAWHVRTKRVWVLGGLVLFSWILALGENGFVFSWIRKFLPIIGFARFPIKFVLLGAFALPLLSAFALASLASSSNERRLHGLVTGVVVTLVLMAGIVWFAQEYPYPLQRWPDLWQNAALRAIFLLIILGGCCAAVFIPQLRRRQIFAIGVFVAVFADILTHTEQQNPTIPTALFAKGLWQERNGKSVGRVFISPESEKRLLRSTVRDPVHDFLGKRLALWSNLNVVDGVPKVNGSSTLQLREQNMLERSLYGSNTVALPNGILDFLGVSHITGSNTVDWTARTSALPLVTAGQRPIFVPSEDELPAVLADNFDPRKIVCLPQHLRAAVLATNQTQATITDLQCSAQRLVFTVTAAEPAIVVLAQSYYHAWKARVDGKPVPVWRANHAFQAFQIPSGEHRVVLMYQDGRLLPGGTISGMAALVCVILWRRRASAVQQPPGLDKSETPAGTAASSRTSLEC